MMRSDDIKARTKRFAPEIIRLSSVIPRRQAGTILSRQLLKSGTSVGAHCAEASRSRSDSEFISKLETDLQELEETRYWLELIADSGSASPDRVSYLLGEANELAALLVTAVKTVKARRSRDPHSQATRLIIHHSSFIIHHFQKEP